MVNFDSGFSRCQIVFDLVSRLGLPTNQGPEFIRASTSNLFANGYASSRCTFSSMMFCGT